MLFRAPLLSGTRIANQILGYGEPDGDRTHDPLIKSQMLYP